MQVKDTESICGKEQSNEVWKGRRIVKCWWRGSVLSIWVLVDGTIEDHEKSTSYADPEMRTVVFLDDGLPKL